MSYNHYMKGSSILKLIDCYAPKTKFYMKKVSDEFFRGSSPEIKDIKILADMGIKRVINLKTIPSDEYIKFHKEADKNGLEYVNIPLNPLNVRKYLLEVVNAVNKVSPSNSTLVHCAYGQDRTGFAVALYRFLKQNWTMTKAVEEMKENGFKPVLINITGLLKQIGAYRKA